MLKLKKIKIIARQEIGKPEGGLYDDYGLKVLNGYLEKYIEVENDEDINKAVKAFIEENNLNSFWNTTYEVVNE